MRAAWRDWGEVCGYCLGQPAKAEFVIVLLRRPLGRPSNGTPTLQKGVRGFYRAKLKALEAGAARTGVEANLVAELGANPGPITVGAMSAWTSRAWVRCTP